MSVRPSEPSSPDTDADEVFLDELFERLVDLRAEGERPDLTALLGHRDHLLADADALWRLACDLAGSGPGAERVGGYQLIRELGRGAMGVVYLARQEALGGRPVALKLLSGSPVASDNDRRRFRDEAEALARVRHPNVVEVFDVVQADGLDAFAMAWVQGGSLADLLDRRRAWLTGRDPGSRAGSSRGDTTSSDDLARLPTRRWVPFVCHLGAQLGRALQAVHDAGLTHRDVKPSNVLLRPDGTPLLSDFGLVRDLDRSRHTQAGFLGTLSFAAPEQVRGDDPAPAADVYALGATLYYALCGALPVEGTTEAAVLATLEQRGVRSLRARAPDLPRDLVTVVHHALEFEPGDRYASAAELADDLERVVALRPIRARPPSVLARVRSWTRRNRRVVVTAVAVAALVVLGAVAWTDELARRRELPRRVEAHVSDARLALLDTELRARTDLALREAGPAFVELISAQAGRALRDYDAALALDDDHAAARAERHAAALALAVLAETSPDAEVVDVVRATWPLTARAWTRAADRAGAQTFDTLLALHARDAPELDPTDLRALGLFAWLVGDASLARDAWTRREDLADADPFLDGLLGHSQLALGQPAVAYPRLLRAAEAFPQAGFLHAAAARAALICGDVARARRLHDRAAQAALPAAADDLTALGADLAWVHGDLDGAHATYESERLDAAYERGAQLAMQRGQWDTVVYDSSTLVSNTPDDLALGRQLVRAARRWWGALDGDARADALREGLRGERGWFGHVFGILSLLQDVRDRVVAAHEPSRAPAAFQLDGERALFDAELVAGGRGDGVDGFALSVDARSLDVQRLMARPELHEPLVAAWLSADFATAEALIAGADARLPAGTHAFGPPWAPVPSPLRVVADVPDLAIDLGRVWQPFHAPAGDLDGDGLGDALLGVVDPDQRGGHVLAVSSASGARLHGLVGERFEHFGLSVAWLGDVDGDGVGDWLAGSDRVELKEPGRVRVLSGADGQRLASLDGAPGDGMASRLLGLGDVDADGRSDFAVGWGFADGAAGAWTGKVVAYDADGRERWCREGQLAGARYGNGLAHVGDVDGDGVHDLAVSVDANADGRPWLELISGVDGRPLQAVELDVTSVQLRVLDDVDGDGACDVPVTLTGPDGRPRVEVRALDDDRVLASADAPRPNDGFGMFASMLGDLTGDGRSEWCVSSLSGRSPVRPRVHVYDADGTPLVELEGYVWLVRLGHGALLGEPSDKRLLAIGLEAWSRYAPRPVGGPVRVTVLEWDG